MRLDLTLDDQTILEELGARLARYRLNRNLKQEALADQAGVSRATVARLEKGSPTSLTNLIRILRALNLLENLDALLPEPPLSPIQQLRTKKRQRRRASARTETNGVAGLPAKKEGPGEGALWTWGDNE